MGLILPRSTACHLHDPDAQRRVALGQPRNRSAIKACAADWHAARWTVATGVRMAAADEGIGGLAAATAIAALILAPAGLVSGMDSLVQPHILLLGRLVALLASAIPYSCEIAALCRLPKRALSVLLALEPAAAALAGAVLLGQFMGRSGVVAVGLVVGTAAGSTLTTTRTKSAARTPADAAGPPPPVNRRAPHDQADVTRTLGTEFHRPGCRTGAARTRAVLRHLRQPVRWLGARHGTLRVATVHVDRAHPGRWPLVDRHSRAPHPDLRQTARRGRQRPPFRQRARRVGRR